MRNLNFTTFCLWVFICLFSIQCESQNPIMNKKNELPKKDLTTSEEEWKEVLSPDEYYVLREKGTERPFTGEYNMHFEEGTYVCKGCGVPLFDSDSKFDSHCGWPSFDEGIAKGNIKEKIDKSHGMTRTEIVCANCGGHLGHVFNDGPTDTGLRYCVNSVSIDFEPEKDNENKEKEDDENN